MDETSLLVVPRTATLKSDSGERTTLPLSEWRCLDAYVLLGEPGSGKTTAFMHEVAQLKGQAVFVTARDFLTIGPPSGWRDEILFIDALDERRGSMPSATGPLDGIRRQLKELGMPKFRLACREADWIVGGASDLKAVVPSGNVKELWLNPFSEADIRMMLDSHRPHKVKNVDEFFEKAQLRRLTPLLHNPLLLNLLVEAVNKSDWPESRSETYELACEKMALEHNADHRRSVGFCVRPVEECLAIAGKLCAILLLSDAQYLTLDPTDLGSDAVRLSELSPSFDVSPEYILHVANSKLFVVEGENRFPRHRTISEYLAGRSLAEHIENRGLPVQRVLALMMAADGAVVDSLRGLYGWLALHCSSARELLVGTDPLGLILYGDVRPFSIAEKIWVLEALKNEASKFPWFRSENWESHPFGALGSADMYQVFTDMLRNKSRSLSHQAALNCVLDAIEYGDEMPHLVPDLLGILRDTTYTSAIRQSALTAWVGNIKSPANQGLQLLDGIEKGDIADEDDELCAVLLSALFPDHLPAVVALQHLHPRKNPDLIGSYRMFWSIDFPRRTKTTELEIVLDQFASKFSLARKNDELDLQFDDVRNVAHKCLIRGIKELGDDIPDSKLYQWLGICLNSYGSTIASEDGSTEIVRWLESRPERMKGIYQYGSSTLSIRQAEETIGLWKVVAHLCNAQRPGDWYFWLLEQAALTQNPALAKAWLIEATHHAMRSDHQNPSLLTLEVVEDRIRAVEASFPSAGNWILEVTSWPLDHWEGREHRRKIESSRENELEKEKRRVSVHSELSEIFAGIASFRRMGEIARAYRKQYTNIHGETALERVCDYLVISEADGMQAIEGIKGVLNRTDLPCAERIEALHLVNRHSLIDAACLLAAELSYEEDPKCVASWTDSLVQTLAAFHLIGGRGEKVDWFGAMCLSHKSALFPVFQRIGMHYLVDVSYPSLIAPQYFAGIDGCGTLIKELLVSFIEAIPAVPSEGQLRILKGGLIPGAKGHLSTTELQKLINARLAEPNLSVEFRSIFLVTGLFVSPEMHLAELLKLARTSPESVPEIRAVFSEQSSETEKLAEQSPGSVGAIAECLAELAVATGEPTVVEDDSPFGGRSRVIQQLTNQLSMISDSAAGRELLRLRRLKVTEHWAIHLEWCIRKQARLSRLANFKSPSIGAVVKFMRNGSPANSRDMASLFIDQLGWLAKRIRFEETNQLSLFWTHGKDHRPRSKVENDCRDVLQALLRALMLQVGVQVEKESYAAGDKRTDLQLSTVSDGERVIVPIEIKKDDHPEVWTAWKGQLESRYMANPAAQQTGVYIVLWFGERPKTSPTKVRPHSAQHMADLLSAEIPEDRRGHVLGLVVDLSPRNA